MKRFVQGTDRTQSILLPEQLEDYVSEDNPSESSMSLSIRLILNRLALAARSQLRPDGRLIIPACC